MLRRLLTLTALLAQLTLPVAARTWTSSEGSTVEAELAGREGDFVILARPNGSRIKIEVRHLSAADQAYIAQEDAPPAPTPASSPAPLPHHAFGPVSFQPPADVRTDQIPGFSPQAPDEAGYLGLQFGPSPNDVLYLMVDTTSSRELPQGLYRYSPRHRVYGTTREVAGKKGKHGEDRTLRFTNLQLAARFGTLQATYDIELTFGIERNDVLAMLVEVQLLDSGRPTRFTMGGFVNEELLTGPGVIPVLPLLAPPSLRAAVRTTTLQPTVTSDVTMGPFKVQPVGRKIPMTVAAESGKIVERLKHEISEEDLLSFGHAGPRSPLIDVKAGTTYTLNAMADMGPVIGELTASKTFKTKGGER